MASEDSDQVVPGLAMIHRLPDLHDLRETRRREMTPVLHQSDALRELLEVGALRRAKRIPFEERNDRFDELRSIRNDVLPQVLLVVVVPLVDVDPPHSEEALELLEAAHTLHPLRHGEPRSYLDAGLVAGSARSVWLPNEADREAPFSVYETDHPTTELDQPFLLVFRTRHVVTMVNALSDVYEVARDTTGFPAYSQMRTVPLLARGATYSSADTALSIADTIP